MLGDDARKILTVMWNTYRNDPSKIDLSYICQKSQRTIDQVKDAINLLVKEEYVLWDREANTFRVIYSREDSKPVKLQGRNA